MINATQMAKPFGKRPVDWLQNSQTSDYLSELSKVRKSTLADLVRVTKGGNNPGTWMHEDVALEFARWLSPAFAIWCNDRIKELLTIGMTATQPTLEAMLDNPDLVIVLATQLKMQREENARLESENRQQMAVIEQQTPKVEYFQKFMTSQHGSTDTCIRELVKQTHMKSEKRFIKWMLDKSILYRKRANNGKAGRLIPMAEWAGCFEYFDAYNENNDWSGKHLKFNPFGKLKVAKLYHDEHPEEFDIVESIIGFN
jgi:phage antirepressor YoqD-like protein